MLGWGRLLFGIRFFEISPALKQFGFNCKTQDTGTYNNRDLLLDRLKSLCTSQIKLDTPKATLNQVKVWLVKLLTKSDNSSIYATIVKCRP